MGYIQLRVDDGLKGQACKIFDELGIDLSTAVRIFLKMTVSVGGMPFDMKLSKSTLSAIASIEKMRDISESNGNSEMTLDEINEEIRLARLERKKK